MFLFNINVFGFKKHKLKKKTPMFGQEGGLQQNIFFITCVLQNVKNDHFVCPFLGQILVEVQKHYKNR